MNYQGITLRMTTEAGAFFSLGIGLGLCLPYLQKKCLKYQKSHREKMYSLSLKKKSPKCLVCGGAGYIGTHTIVSLLEAGYDVVIVDNLSNSKETSVDRLRKLTKCDVNRISLFVIDMCNLRDLESVFLESGPFDCCIHLAGYKAVGESVLYPLKYIENNIMSTVQLLKLLDKYACRSLVFSSSATVYGNSKYFPYNELSLTGIGITNAYARSKFMIEQILQDFHASKKTEYTGLKNPWYIVSLRYFNPVGAHESGLLGEDPYGVPNNLVPLITQVLQGKREKLSIYGNDYETNDGTCLRDYIHVMDLAEGHVSALRYIDDNKRKKGEGMQEVFNLGSGNGYSVIQMIKAMEKASGYKVPFSITPRRPGDVCTSYASTRKANTILNWKATRSLDTICKDTWKWILNSKK